MWFNYYWPPPEKVGHVEYLTEFFLWMFLSMTGRLLEKMTAIEYVTDKKKCTTDRRRFLGLSLGVVDFSDVLPKHRLRIWLRCSLLGMR